MRNRNKWNKILNQETAPLSLKPKIAKTEDREACQKKTWKDFASL